MQVHLKERMHALEEKNNLGTELEQTKELRPGFLKDDD